MEKKLVGFIVAMLSIGTICGYSFNLFLTQIQTSTLNEQIDTLQAQVTELQTNLASNVSRNAELEDNITTLRASLDSNLTKITELVGKLSTLQANWIRMSLK